LEAREEVAYFPLLGKEVLEAPGLLEVRLLHPVEREPI